MHSNSQKNKTVLLGIPYDRNSSYLRGTALAPAQIREALFCESSNMWTESGLNLDNHPDWQDASDIISPRERSARFD